jgi:glutamyl-tRNA synthetase/nondiscriminating glutamyl-tRNA synthetase
MSVRVRFAPSPTGHLHVGNARTAIFNWLLARGQDGTFILRIEDTDAERSTAASEQSILDDLQWLGLDWDEGPLVGGPRGPYRQSERLGLYREHIDRLLAAGHAYYCFCSAEQLDADRQAMLAAGQAPRYRGTCRGLDPAESRRRVAAGEPAVVRFAVPQDRTVTFSDAVRGHVSFGTDVIGDPVLQRSDGMPAYNFAVVVDDALMGVTHVVRGEDHVSNTPRQILLYEALGYDVPVFAHVSLVLGPDHTPLSKRHGATSVSEFRARGCLPEALVNYLALIGWSPGGGEELVPPAQLASRFRLEDVGHSAGVFDERKLAWVNRHYLKDASASRLSGIVLPFFQQAGWIRADTPDARLFVESLLPMISGSVDFLAEAADRVRFLFEYDPAAALAQPAIATELATPEARAVVTALAADLRDAPPLASRDEFRAAAQRVRSRTGQKGRQLFHPIRLALTGQSEGAELDLAVPAIERAAALPAEAGVVPVASARDRAERFAAALTSRDTIR